MSSASRSVVTLEQLVALNDEIASLVRAGIPLESGLCEGADASRAGGDFAHTLVARMQAGASLVEALEAEEDRIPRVYRTVVEAGVRAGRLSVALEALANFSRDVLDLRRQIGAAMVYPLIVCSLGYALFLVFMVDLVERFRETYTMFRLPIHGPLRFLITVVQRAELWWWIPPAMLLAGLIWWICTRQANALGFRGAARPLGWIPGVRRIGKYLQCANFAELLALLMEHEVPLGEGLRLSADATTDRNLQRAAHRLAEVVERGGTAADEPATSAEFPPFLNWVLAQGGQGARPVRMLRHAAGFYRRRAMNLTNWFKVLFPMMTALVIGGGITLLYMIALFGPLAVFWKDLGVE